MNIEFKNKLKMDANGFKTFFKNKISELNLYLQSAEAAYMAGNEAVSLFKENFRKEGFVNSGLHKWQPSKRRTDSKNYKVATRGKYKGQPRAKNASATKPTLTQSGNLGRSLQFKIAGKGKVIIFSDLPYAAVHNEGLKAGRGKGFTMPKRQFIGKSIELSNQLNKKLLDKAKQILGK